MKWFNLFSLVLDLLVEYRQWKKDRFGSNGTPGQLKH